MPQNSAQDKTEEATPGHRRKARKEGRIPQSQEVPSALMMVALLVVLALAGPSLCGYFVRWMRDGLCLSHRGGMDITSASTLLKDAGMQCMLAITPFLLAGAAVSVFSGLVTSGWAYSPKALAFKLDRISPIKGAKNLVSLKSLVLVVVSIAKTVVIVAIVYNYVGDNLPAILTMRHAGPEAILVTSCRLVFGLVVRVTIGLMAIALADLLYQRWQYSRDLRMSKQEVKEEHKQYEMSSLIKRRIRGVQMELARKKMLQDVPTADVVLANPTHVAVAIKYDAASMDAPIVVGKGPDLMCEKIKEIARAHKVPILHRPELARALYGAVDVGDPVPQALFVAVAEVLAMIYRLGHRRRKN